MVRYISLLYTSLFFLLLFSRKPIHTVLPISQHEDRANFEKIYKPSQVPLLSQCLSFRRVSSFVSYNVQWISFQLTSTEHDWIYGSMIFLSISIPRPTSHVSLMGAGQTPEIMTRGRPATGWRRAFGDGTQVHLGMVLRSWSETVPRCTWR
jgi:hypothetical protein